jgi:hypothetical protein
MLQEQTHSVNFFFDPSVLWAPTVRTLSETSNDHALCCMLNHGNILVQSLNCLSLSSCQLESTLTTPAQLLLLQSQQGDLVGHHLRLSNILERICQPSCEPLYMTNTTVNRKHFSGYIFCTESFCSQKTHNRLLLSCGILLKHGHYFHY